MKRLVLLLLALLASGCATSRTQRFLSEHTEGHVFAAPIAQVWPAAKAVLADRGFPPEDAGPYRLQTAILTPDGNLGDAPTTSSAASAPGAAGSGRRGRGGAGGLQAPTHSKEMWHFVVHGEVVDEGHCRVRFTRFSRSSIDVPEDVSDDAELEWALIARVEPEAAAKLRQQAQGEDVLLPEAKGPP